MFELLCLLPIVQAGAAARFAVGSAHMDQFDSFGEIQNEMRFETRDDFACCPVAKDVGNNQVVRDHQRLVDGKQPDLVQGRPPVHTPRLALFLNVPDRLCGIGGSGKARQSTEQPGIVEPGVLLPFLQPTPGTEALPLLADGVVSAEVQVPVAGIAGLDQQLGIRNGNLSGPFPVALLNGTVPFRVELGPNAGSVVRNERIELYIPHAQSELVVMVPAEIGVDKHLQTFVVEDHPVTHAPLIADIAHAGLRAANGQVDLVDVADGGELCPGRRRDALVEPDEIARKRVRLPAGGRRACRL